MPVYNACILIYLSTSGNSELKVEIPKRNHDVAPKMGPPKGKGHKNESKMKPLTGPRYTLKCAGLHQARKIESLILDQMPSVPTIRVCYLPCLSKTPSILISLGPIVTMDSMDIEKKCLEGISVSTTLLFYPICSPSACTISFQQSSGPTMGKLCTVRHLVKRITICDICVRGRQSFTAG